jgi:hypothetical protein
MVNNREDGQLQKGQVVGLLLLPADKQSSETVDPTVGALYDPSSKQYQSLTCYHSQISFSNQVTHRGKQKNNNHY